MLEIIDKIEDSFNESNAIVYFTATWCQPCKLIKPQFARAGTIDKENKYYIVDVDNMIQNTWVYTILCQYHKSLF